MDIYKVFKKPPWQWFFMKLSCPGKRRKVDTQLVEILSQSETFISLIQYSHCCLVFFNSSMLDCLPPTPMLIHQNNLSTWWKQPDYHTHWARDFELIIMLTHTAFSVHHKCPALGTPFVFRVKIVYPFQEICCLCQILKLDLKVFMVSYCCMRNCKQILKAQRP